MLPSSDVRWMMGLHKLVFESKKIFTIPLNLYWIKPISK